MKKEPFKPNQLYHIRNVANNQENFFYEHANYLYFLQLLDKHISQIAYLEAYCLLDDRFEILIRIKSDYQIPDKFKTKMHLPLSNCFNAYTKAFNRKYTRTGSLFREHFFRKKIVAEKIPDILEHIRLLPLKTRKIKNEKSYPYSSF